MSHDRNIHSGQRFLPLERAQAIVEVAKGLRHAARVLTARGHAAGVVVGKHGVAATAQAFDLLHVGLMSAAHAVIEHDQPTRLRCIVGIEKATQRVSRARTEGVRLRMQSGEILGREIKHAAVVVAAAVGHLLVLVEDQFFKQHKCPPCGHGLLTVYHISHSL